MIGVEDLRGYVGALPGVEEKPHFGRPAFRVRDKLFLSVHTGEGEAFAIIHVSQDEAAAVVAADPDVCEEVWRTHGGRRIFVGLRVDLAEIAVERCRELVEHAWRDKAPKRLVADYDQKG